jgi:hypothetical protein
MQHSNLAPYVASAVFCFTMASGLASGCNRMSDPENTDNITDAEVEEEPGVRMDNCSFTEKQKEAAPIASILADEVPCFSGTLHFDAHSEIEEAYFNIDNVLRLTACFDDGANRRVALPIAQQAQNALEGESFSSCFASSGWRIAGDTDVQLGQTADVIDAVCPESWKEADESYKIAFDDQGRASDVFCTADLGGEAIFRKIDCIDLENGAAMSELIQCIRNALVGHQFPCLAGYGICHENTLIDP